MFLGIYSQQRTTNEIYNKQIQDAYLLFQKRPKGYQQIRVRHPRLAALPLTLSRDKKRKDFRKRTIIRRVRLIGTYQSGFFGPCWWVFGPP